MLSRRVFPRIFHKKHFSTEKGQTTALYDFHQEKGGKIVNFGGFLLPVQYSDQSIVNSHLFTRTSASLFDVSHMLQTEIKGPDSIKLFESICTADLVSLPPNSSVLTVFTNKNGGILDDLIVTKVTEQHLYVVSNAARKEHDQKHIQNALATSKANANIEFYSPEQRGLLALQGPKASEILQALARHLDLSKQYFMTSFETDLAGALCRVTRCGYTGEDGFEISCPANHSVVLAREILKNPLCKLAGLGARDSLRLEAGLCLYGSDLDDKTTPIDGALTWLIAKKRRAQADFPGAKTILEQIKNGSQIKRVGIVTEMGPPPRHGAEIVSIDGASKFGHVTSGCPSPSLPGKNIAMGYVPTNLSKVGGIVGLKIRGKIYEGVISKMPFVKANYYNKPK